MSTSDDRSTISQPEVGEICVMLSAAGVDPGIREFQEDLIRRYDGGAIEGLHLTLQRLRPPPGRGDARMVREIRAALSGVGSLSVQGTDAFFMHSGFRGSAIIKVRVRHEPDAAQRIEGFSCELRAKGYETQYPYVADQHEDGEPVAIPDGGSSWADVHLDLDTADVARIAGQNSGEGLAEWRMGEADGRARYPLIAPIRTPWAKCFCRYG